MKYKKIVGLIIVSGLLLMSFVRVEKTKIYLPLIYQETTPLPTLTPTPTQIPTNTATSIPTATRTPTATTIPSITPIPTATTIPTSVPSGVRILSNHSYYVDTINYLHIVGEVSNNTPDYLRYVEIHVNIFNSSGQLLTTDFAFVQLDSLPAWDKGCFHLIVLDTPANWSYYKFEAPTYWIDGSPPSNLTIFNDSGAYNSTFGWYTIIGQVRNDGTVPITYVQPIGTLYNSTNTVIGCDFTFVNSTDLSPGQTSSFEMYFMGRDYFDAFSYRLQVD